MHQTGFGLSTPLNKVLVDGKSISSNGRLVSKMANSNENLGSVMNNKPL